MNTDNKMQELEAATISREAAFSAYIANVNARTAACGSNAPRESLDTYIAANQATDALWNVYMTACGNAK